MIKDVIAEILEAEKKADEILQVAHEKEKEITFSTQSSIEQMKIATAQETKAEVGAIISAAEKKAENSAVELLKDNVSAINTKVKNAEKNSQRVIEYLVDALNKQLKSN